MSDLAECPVVPVSLEKHPNADALSLVRVGGFTVVVKTDEWKDRTEGIFIAPDSIFEGQRIKPRKFRNVLSQGMLVPIGTDVSGVTRYEPDDERSSNEFQEESPPTGIFSPKYDVMSYNGMLRFANPLFLPGEGVLVTEKLNGENMRITFANDRLWVGSRNFWRKEAPGDKFWATVTPQMRETAMRHNRHVFYGEKYDGRFFQFDIMNPDGQWVDARLARFAGMLPVPELYRGPFDFELVSRLVTGVCTVNGAPREGIVIQAIDEREVSGVGRLKLKMVGAHV